MDLRCVSGILHGKLMDGLLEVRCKSNRCGHRPGTIILHRFDVLSGQLVETKKFTDPIGGKHAARHGLPIRNA